MSKATKNFNKIKLYKNGYYVTFERNIFSSIPYIVTLKNNNDELLDKMRCDDFDNANDYFKAFQKIARKGGK